jgi:hypothetical protein
MKPYETRLHGRLRWSVAATIAFCAAPALVWGQTNTPEDKVENAMSAAPASIARNATIMDWPSEAKGRLRELRKGSNGWTCLPDEPSTPTNDPMCLDKMWMVWLEAFMAGAKPRITAPGIGYMFQGGSAADNDDPSVQAPPPGKDWQIDPPHLMVLIPGKWDPAVFTKDHHSGGPYVMFGGTPYEHLMVPVE